MDADLTSTGTKNVPSESERPAPETRPAGEQGATTSARLAWPLLAALIVTLSFLSLPFAPPELSPDTSWCAVLDYARQHGLQSGTDLVWTYGPAGFLTTGYISTHGTWLQVLGNVGLCYVIAVGLCLLAWRLRGLARWLLLGVFVFVCGNIEPRTDLVVKLGMLVWGLLCWVETDRRLVFAVVCFAAFTAFCSLTKTSFLALALAGVGLIAADLLARRQRRLALALPLVFVLAFVFGWLMLGQRLGNLGPYLHHSLAIISGYNQAMSAEGLASLIQRGVITALLAAGLVLVRGATAFPADEPNRNWRRVLLLAWLLAALFLEWKHGFARGHAGHVVFFFGYVPVLALALEAVPCARPGSLRWSRGLALACCLVCLATLLSSFFPSLLMALSQPFRAGGYNLGCLVNPANYRRRTAEGLDARRREADLPKLRALVGSKTVDVFGHLQSFALLNTMNYHPRPVFQSYAAGNADLLRLNEQFYNSAAAPEFVLFCLGPMDHKFPPLEDGLVLGQLLRGYSPVAAEGPFLLLRGGTVPPAKLTLLREGTVTRGQKLDLTGCGEGKLWLEFHLSPSGLGRLRQFFYQPPAVRLAAWPEASPGPPVKRRAPPSLLAAGFLASPLLLDNRDVARFYSGEPLARPAAYSVELSPEDARYWLPKIGFKIYRWNE